MRSKFKVPMILIIITIILMILIGSISTLNAFGFGTPSLVLFGSIIISIFLFLGVFSGLYFYLADVFLLYKPIRNFKGRLIKWGKKIMVVVFALIISLVALLGTFIVYWTARIPPSYEVDPILHLQTWTAIPSGDDIAKQHKSNTDLFYWNGEFYVVYQSSKWHLQDLNGELVVASSPDASEGSWTELATIKGPGHNDVRDPLIQDIDGTLFLYFLPNFLFDPEPNTTYYCSSINGKDWTDPVEIYVNVSLGSGWELQNGWIFGRQEPLTFNNITWYTMAFGAKEDKWMTILIETQDGINWTEVSEVYDTYPSSEPCMEFLPSGEIIATLRVSAMSSWTGYDFGTPYAGTIIATSYNNRTGWSYSPEFQTRMDGGKMFTLENRTRIFIAGRNHLGPKIDNGDHVSRKRTSVYEVLPDRLVHLFDLPSDGDTAYTGIVIEGGNVYVSYYTCPINHDLPWIIGITMLTRTEIRIARFSATGLVQYASNIRGELGV
jgi:hypothetical protein